MRRPPLSEQAAIVCFLDCADRRIRRYIRTKEKLIALLEEQKQAIIHQAVTGRIDVRTGQPYPAYKPSRVEWLGGVPAHWEVRRVRVYRLSNVAPPQANLETLDTSTPMENFLGCESPMSRRGDKYLEETTQRLSLDADSR